MRIQTILNHVEKFKPFVVGKSRLEKHDDGPALVVQMRARKNGRVFCSGCGRPALRTTASRNGGSSTCRSGGCWSFWPTGCGGWTASSVG